MKLVLAGVLLLAPAAWCQNRFEKFDRDLKQAADELGISDLRASVVESGKVVWSNGASKTWHASLAWSTQDLFGERVVWSYEPTVLMVKIPGKKLGLTVSANSKALTEAARLEDGNLARSTIALAFFRDVATLGDSERDELIDHALTALYRGENEKSAALAQQALDRFPELDSTPDVTLLYLFAELGFRETEASATAVIQAHPELPTAWFYYGRYLENGKRYREAAACFEKITLHQPPWHHWTVAAARKELTYLKTY
jgi:hypothetical protein